MGMEIHNTLNNVISDVLNVKNENIFWLLRTESFGMFQWTFSIGFRTRLLYIIFFCLLQESSDPASNLLREVFTYDLYW
jgi:hypothetical protein